MSNDFDPIIDQWYQHLDKGQRFYVTAIDTESDSVEVQHFDGDVEEFSLSDWRELDIELSEEPESWSGPVDISEEDDFGTEVTDTSRSDWDEPMDEFRMTEKESAKPGLDEDDYGEGFIEEDPVGSGDGIPGGLGQSILNLSQRPDGVYEEILNDTWHAEYSEHPETGLWRVDIYKHDVPEWRNADFESLEDAMEAVQNYYAQI